MHKKGQVSLEALVKFIPHLLITIGLLAIAVYVILIFTASEKTPEEQDFQRVLAEIDELISAEYKEPQAITIPIQKTSPLDIVTYPGMSAETPKQCQKQSCICLYYTKENKIKEICKMYSQIKSQCNIQQCGDICFPSVKRLSLQKGETTATITRGCHELTIT